MSKLVECVPNFSEGRRPEVIEAIAEEVRQVANVKLLDVKPDASHNRVVVPFVGVPEAVKRAAFNACKKAAELISMQRYSIQEVSEMVGFNDTATFRKRFTEQYGVTPSQYLPGKN